MELEPLVLEPAFAKSEGVDTRTARRWRHAGLGPKYIRIGLRKIAYEPAEIRRWRQDRTFGSRAEELAAQAKGA